MTKLGNLLPTSILLLPSVITGKLQRRRCQPRVSQQVICASLGLHLHTAPVRSSLQLLFPNILLTRRLRLWSVMDQGIVPNVLELVVMRYNPHHICVLSLLLPSTTVLCQVKVSVFLRANFLSHPMLLIMMMSSTTSGPSIIQGILFWPMPHMVRPSPLIVVKWKVLSFIDAPILGAGKE